MVDFPTPPLPDPTAMIVRPCFAAVIAIPFAAQLACQSVLILLDPSIPSYGVLANALAGPAAPAGTVLGLLACLLLPVAPGLGGLVSQLAWVPSAWIAAVAQFFSGLPGSRLPWLDGAFGAVLLAITVAVLLVPFIVRRVRRGEA